MQVDFATAPAEMADLATTTALASAPSVPPTPDLTTDLRERIGAIHDDPDFMTSLARGLLVLSVFARHPRGLTMAQASKETGISRAAARRVLYTLGKLGYVGERERGYVLLPRALGRGGIDLATTALARAAQPVLDALHARLGEPCWLGVLDGDEVICLAHSEQTLQLAPCPRLNDRLPADATAMGRMLLAALPRAGLDQYLQRLALRAPAASATATAEFAERLAGVREQDMALLDQPLQPGRCSLAVPVRSRDGAILAALAISTDSARIARPQQHDALLRPLRQSAGQLAALLN